MNVLAIDPGPSTGLAWRRAASRQEVLFDGKAEGETVVGQMILPWHEAWDWLDAWMSLYGDVVCETFHITGPRDVNSNITIETIGVARFLAGQNFLPFSEQTPSASSLFDPKWAKLRRMGWYVPNSADHGNSATRHLLLRCTVLGLVEPNAG